jgi:hypothetical protein
MWMKELRWRVHALQHVTKYQENPLSHEELSSL